MNPLKKTQTISHNKYPVHTASELTSKQWKCGSAKDIAEQFLGIEKALNAAVHRIEELEAHIEELEEGLETQGTALTATIVSLLKLMNDTDTEEYSDDDGEDEELGSQPE